jgi:hypothetical protein
MAIQQNHRARIPVSLDVTLGVNTIASTSMGSTTMTIRDVAIAAFAAIPVQSTPITTVATLLAALQTAPV